MVKKYMTLREVRIVAIFILPLILTNVIFKSIKSNTVCIFCIEKQIKDKATKRKDKMEDKWRRK